MSPLAPPRQCGFDGNSATNFECLYSGKSTQKSAILFAHHGQKRRRKTSHSPPRLRYFELNNSGHKGRQNIGYLYARLNANQTAGNRRQFQSP